MPSLTERVHTVQEDARQTASGLRVLSLHEQAGAAVDGRGDGVLISCSIERATSSQGEFADAPWLDATARKQLLDELAALDAQTDRNSPAFASAADALASHIEATFGLRQ